MPETQDVPPNEGMAGAEVRLLDFVGSLILDVARTNSRVTQQEIALWLAKVTLGASR